MHYSTIASAAALLATVRAAPSSNANLFNLNSTCIETEPKVRVYNRCPYDVYLWSVLTGPGCPTGGAGAFVKQGEFYQENYRPAVGGIGTSIKVSKTEDCDPDQLLQLEYYIETSKPGYNYNYLDVSYVNCAESGKNCPTKSEGFYLKSGNVDGKFAANSLNNICPILSCGSFDECAKMAYVKWDDVQTKSCDPSADLDFYMCGGEAPGADTPTVIASSSEAYEAPSSTSTEEEVAEPTSTVAAEPSAYSSVEVQVAAAEITPAAVVASKPPHVKTEVVYVTEIAYVNAKRHAHGHKHQHFHA